MREKCIALGCENLVRAEDLVLCDEHAVAWRTDLERGTRADELATRDRRTQMFLLQQNLPPRITTPDQEPRPSRARTSEESPAATPTTGPRFTLLEID